MTPVNAFGSTAEEGAKVRMVTTFTEGERLVAALCVKSSCVLICAV